MKTKPTSHEAAQRKLWKADLRTLDAALRKVSSDWTAESKRVFSEVAKAQKALEKAQLKAARFQARREKQMPKSVHAIHRRIAVLRGRLSS